MKSVHNIIEKVLRFPSFYLLLLRSGHFLSQTLIPLPPNKYVKPPFIIYSNNWRSVGRRWELRTTTAVDHMFLTFNDYLPELHIRWGHNKFWRCTWSASVIMWRSVDGRDVRVNVVHCLKEGEGETRRSVYVMYHLLPSAHQQHSKVIAERKNRQLQFIYLPRSIGNFQSDFVL